jgi:hypothetical protein
MPRKRVASPKKPTRGGNNGGGRKKMWETLNMPAKLELVEGWARNGMIDENIMEALGIKKDTFYRWKKEKPEFAAALSRGKEVADIQVESALFRRALGYKFEEVTRELLPVVIEGELQRDKYGMPIQELQITKAVTKEVAPEVAAQIFWLKNRKPEQWRDKQEIKHTGGPVTFVNDLPPDNND